MRLLIAIITFICFTKLCWCDSEYSVGDFQIFGAVYCPFEGNWEWAVRLWNEEGGSRFKPPNKHGVSNDKLQTFNFNKKDNLPDESEYFYFGIETTCTTDRSWKHKRTEHFSISDKKKSQFYHVFLAWNPQNSKDTSIYGKLFMKYLGDECLKADCSNIRDRVIEGCNALEKTSAPCKSEFEKTISTYCNLNGGSNGKLCVPYVSTTASPSTTTQKSSSIVIIIGVSIGAVVLIAAVVAFICCRKRKNADTTGTNTVAPTTSKSKTKTMATTTATTKKTNKTTMGTGTGEKAFET